MKKKERNIAFRLLLSVAVLLTVWGCSSSVATHGDGNVITRTIPVEEFDAIDVMGASIVIHYVQHDSMPAMEVSTDKNLIDRYRFDVKRGTLIIRPKRNKNLRPTIFTVALSSSRLDKIALSGEIHFEAATPLHSDKLRLDQSGSGVVSFADNLLVDKLKVSMSGDCELNALKLNSRSVSCEMAGKGIIRMAGLSDESKFSISGNGIVDALNLRVNDLTCKIAGMADMQISVAKSINADLMGNANIRYRGNPAKIKKSLTGPASLVQLNN